MIRTVYDEYDISYYKIYIRYLFFKNVQYSKQISTDILITGNICIIWSISSAKFDNFYVWHFNLQRYFCLPTN